MIDPAPKQRLRLDISDLELAFESVGSHGGELLGLSPTQAFLDRNTGQVVYLDDESEEDVDEDPDKYSDDRYLPVPDDGTRMEFRDLADFIATLDDGPRKTELSRAIEGRGAFRRFRNIVHGSGDIELRHAWNCFEQRRLRERIDAWLQEAGVEPEWAGDIFEPRKLPNPRPELLNAVLEFVQRARRIEGVRRIALLGSLATDKAQPRDVDLLVVIDDTAPLNSLAKASRQLHAKTMQTGESRGTDVFLANPAGDYLGRTCPWKECRPGLRLSCQAQHCGRRHHLYDDLQNIRLEPRVIAHPPIELWPNSGKHPSEVAIPHDVADTLLKPLMAEASNGS